MNFTAPSPPHPNPVVHALDCLVQPEALDATLGIDAGAVPSRLWDAALLAPARDFLGRPGKGFRGRLVELGFELAGGTPGHCPPELGAAIEMLHAGSLIVDDIEDGTATRRGRPALHKVHGVPRALNTGNWMYFAPLMLMDQANLTPGLRDAIRRVAMVTLFRCHHGQALDLSVNVVDLTRREVAGVVESSTRLKTGSLMELAAAMGALAAGGDDARVSALGRFGRELGVGLQMADDLGGILNAAMAHKGREDLVLGRPTWAWALLAWRLDELSYARLVHRLKDLLSGTAEVDDLRATMATPLQHLGPRRVDARLRDAFLALRAAVGDQPRLTAVADEIETLQRSFLP